MMVLHQKLQDGYKISPPPTLLHTYERGREGYDTFSGWGCSEGDFCVKLQNMQRGSICLSK